MRPLIGLLAALLVLAVAPSIAGAAGYTHLLSVSGEFNDAWSETDPADCGENGPGSVNVKFETKHPMRVRVFRDKVGSRPRTKGSGLWVLGKPVGGGWGHAPPLKIDATVTTTDSRVSIPRGPDECLQPDTRYCGTTHPKPALAEVAGYDPKRLYLRTIVADFYFPSGCRVGIVEGWSSPFQQIRGDNGFGDLIFKMPSAKAVRTKKTITLSRSDHYKFTQNRSENGTSVVTDDVSRKVKITLKKL
jgi:hypothetical protein